MDCDSDNPKASQKACNKVLANFENKTGQIPPCLDPCLACKEFEYCVEGQCVDPCADLVDGDPDNECPCNFFDVPMTEDCWIANQDDLLFFSPLGMDSDSCRILTGTQQNGLIRMEARQFAGEFSCVVNGFSSDLCMGPESAFVNGISEAQFLTCLCRIERYADGLEGDSGIDFINGDPSFYCSPCGNGMLEQAEQCDDGNTVPGDGCSADCSFIEPGFQCPTPGSPCTGVCGDGMLTFDEQCDDGNTDAGDGCSADCSFVEPGFECPFPGSPCTQDET